MNMICFSQYIEVFSVSFSLIIFNVQIFHLPGYIYSSVFILFNAIKNWIILISDGHCCTLKCNRVLYIYFVSFPKLLNLFICANSFVGFLRFSLYIRLYLQTSNFTSSFLIWISLFTFLAWLLWLRVWVLYSVELARMWHLCLIANREKL